MGYGVATASQAKFAEPDDALKLRRQCGPPCPPYSVAQDQMQLCPAHERSCFLRTA